MRGTNQKLFRFLLEKCHPPILRIKEKQFGLRRRASGGRSRGAGNQTIRSNKVRAPFKVFDQEQLGDFWARTFQDFSQFQVIFCSSRRRFGAATATHKIKILYSDFSDAAFRGTKRPVFSSTLYKIGIINK